MNGRQVITRFLNQTNISRPRPLTDLRQPLRTQQDVDAILEGLQDGTIDVIATDHAPHSQKDLKIKYIVFTLYACRDCILNGIPTRQLKILKSTVLHSKKPKVFFYDDYAIEFYDDEHSEWEDRFLLLGLSSKLRLLMVCHCYHENESIIRIISARKATKNESKHYRR